MHPLEQLVINNNAEVFSHIHSQSSVQDRIAFLQVQNFVANRLGKYVYLEIGSYLGGSLVPHCADSRCIKIESIDARVVCARNEGTVTKSDYGPQSAEDMLKRLRSIPGVNVEKVRTYDLDAENVRQEDIGNSVDLVLIDGEHTDQAVFSDFLNCRKFCKPETVFLFHDYSCIRKGIITIANLLKKEGSNLAGFRLGGDVFMLIPNSQIRDLPPYFLPYIQKRHAWRRVEFLRSILPEPAIKLARLLRFQTRN